MVKRTCFNLNTPYGQGYTILEKNLIETIRTVTLKKMTWTIRALKKRIQVLIMCARKLGNMYSMPVHIQQNA